MRHFAGLGMVGWGWWDGRAYSITVTCKVEAEYFSFTTKISAEQKVRNSGIVAADVS